MIELSLVIPCYNEAANLRPLIARCEEAFRDSDAEVILVDNGSTDDSPRVLAELLHPAGRIRAIRVEQNQCYGFGILSGLRAAAGRVLGWTHADLQTDPGDALRGMERFNGGTDPARLFVKGRRYGRPWSDVFFTVGMSAFETMLLGTRLWDINAQPTLFPASFFATWIDPPHDFSLDLFAYCQARRLGFAVDRVPVRFDRRRHGQSHWNADWRAKLRFIHRTVAYSVRLRATLRR